MGEDGMNIDISEVRNKKFIYIAHLIMYLFAIGYSVMSIFVNEMEFLSMNITVIACFLSSF